MATVRRRLRSACVQIHHTSESSPRHTMSCLKKLSVLVVPQSCSWVRQRRQERRNTLGISRQRGMSSQIMVCSRGQHVSAQYSA